MFVFISLRPRKSKEAESSEKLKRKNPKSEETKSKTTTNKKTPEKSGQSMNLSSEMDLSSETHVSIMR